MHKKSEKDEACCCSLMTINQELDDIGNEILEIQDIIGFKYPEYYPNGYGIHYDTDESLSNMEKVRLKNHDDYELIRRHRDISQDLRALEKSLYWVSECCGEDTVDKCAKYGKTPQGKSLIGNIFEAGIQHGGKPGIFITNILPEHEKLVKKIDKTNK